MLDLPLPLRPVMALKLWSKLCKLTRWAYDLNPSMSTLLMYIVAKLSYARDRLSVSEHEAHGNGSFAGRTSRFKTSFTQTK